ncbi:4-alpha-glucanotransferase [Maribellus maritimus]|uniref:4-alpha-glucanotransferase n=1 Tax=Maribellus maritimus TaxID=2870838 RepID=UPI001EEA1E20|nr:4-alpha-glucanotransferase [Maribellus maritimus]MCG6186694.1 4-alpha-glucanotransferase [Maribellus maritimus]
MGERRSGILLHVTSLPGSEGIGTFGEDAFRFVDLLAEAGQKIWQILPLGPVGYGNSPYQCYSAFAGNIFLIDSKKLADEGLLDKNDVKNSPRFNSGEVDFANIEKWKLPLLYKAFRKFQTNNYGEFHSEYQTFLKEHSWWLKDFALFMSARSHFKDEQWTTWPDELKFRTPVGIHKFQTKLESDVNFWKFVQFQFFRQWFVLKKYANSKGVKIIGDMPLYVSTDSSDVWTNTDIFILDKKLRPKQVGGVPPDYFSEDGQLWGNPVFDWKRIQERDYDWWMARLHFNLNLFDEIRIDHFRGLESFWAVPASEKTARNGKWLPAKGYEMLSKFNDQIGHLPLIAEDLGLITAEVEKMRLDFGLPGMKVLQFAFRSDATNEYLPHNYTQNFVVYTGTHDNNTTLGWLKALKGKEKKLVKLYLGGTGKEAVKNIIEMTWASTANTAIVPFQDILQLAAKARMNTPGTASGNWGWRFRWKQLKSRQFEFLKAITKIYNR